MDTLRPKALAVPRSWQAGTDRVIHPVKVIDVRSGLTTPGSCQTRESGGSRHSRPEPFASLVKQSRCVTNMVTTSRLR